MLIKNVNDLSGRMIKIASLVITNHRTLTRSQGKEKIEALTDH